VPQAPQELQVLQDPDTQAQELDILLHRYRTVQLLHSLAALVPRVHQGQAHQVPPGALQTVVLRHMLVALPAVEDIRHTQAPELVERPLLQESVLPKPRWHPLQNHKPGLHILSSSSCPPHAPAAKWEEP
jgi:hypothetical protein